MPVGYDYQMFCIIGAVQTLLAAKARSDPTEQKVQSLLDLI